jgi:acetyl-CoA synthetase
MAAGRNIIEKHNRVLPNLVDYASFAASFDWKQASSEIDGLPGGQGLNIAYEAVDRHVHHGKGERLAMRFIRSGGERESYTFSDLSVRSSQFANVLSALNVKRGDRVFVLAGRIPELYITALGTWKHGSVFCPLFSEFGPEPIKARMTLGSGRVLVTTAELYERKVKAIVSDLPDLEHILVVGGYEGTLSFHEQLEQASTDFSIELTDPEEHAILHFTSGTTGTPKGAIHVHQAIVAHHMTGKIALDLHPEDIFWCTADPGWVTGTSYGIISPLTNGVTSIIDEMDFDAERWYQILQSEKVSNWYTAPTAVRMMMKTGREVAQRYEFPHLRFIASVGEPLNPEAVWWSHDILGLPIHDNWWQTETGGIMIANYAAMPIKPGSMGRPFPGIEVALIAEDGSHGTKGELALKVGWPSMFRGYIGDEERYQSCFSQGYYLTGDLAEMDDEGYFWFVGRKDDIIKSSGHLIGPFEVESALMQHPAVAEAAVIGLPDPLAMEIVAAFIALNPGFEVGEELELEILGFARKKLGAAISPKEIHFLADLPKTRSGKVMRRLLKARLLGLPEGDTSTMDTSL